MPALDFLTETLQSPWNFLFWALLIMSLLYLARRPTHAMLRAVGQGVRNAIRLASRSVMAAEQWLRDRNRAIMLSLGRDAKERVIEREFQRVHSVVARDLSGYPALSRVISEQITEIEADYRKSAEVPPTPPEWLDAITEVAKIPARENSAVSEILEDIHKTLENSQKEAMREYRQAIHHRHRLLRKMAPYWRKLAGTMSSVEKKLADLDARIPAIDEHMRQYEAILSGSEAATRQILTSHFTQFFISGLVLAIAIMGGFINFHLIALPLSEILGVYYVGPFKTADIGALVIVMIEITMGIFLMESLRVTRMFPIFSTLDDYKLRVFTVVSFSALLFLAGVEAGLAYMRDLMVADKAALTSALIGEAVAEPQFRWIATVGQMIMGFVLPFALTFVAIPLEAFVNSTRTVVGFSLGAGLQFTAFVLRFVGNIAYSATVVLAHLYDMFIFLPLWIEQFVNGVMARRRRDRADAGLFSGDPAGQAPLLENGLDGRMNLMPEGQPGGSGGYDGVPAQEQLSAYSSSYAESDPRHANMDLSVEEQEFLNSGGYHRDDFQESSVPSQEGQQDARVTLPGSSAA